MREHVGVQSPYKTIRIEDVELAYSDEGTGQTVVCLHATAQGGRDFEHFRSRLLSRKGYRLITLDWQGHGRSGSDNIAFGAVRCESILAGFLDALHIKKAILLGNSIGAAAALRFAYSNPHRVFSVVACNPGGLAPSNLVARTFCSLMVYIAKLGERKKPVFKLLYKALCAALLRGKFAEAQRQRIIDAGFDNAMVMRQAWSSFKTAEGDIRWMMPSIACPVLFAWAKDDVIVSLHSSRKAVLSVPNHELKLLPGGHAAFLESPDDFVKVFTRFHDRLLTSIGGLNNI